MKRIFLLLSLSLIYFESSAQNKIIDDPNAQVRALNNSFHAIQVSSAIDLYLSQSNQESIAVSAADKEDIPHIVTEVDNGVLIIRSDSKSWFRWVKGNRKLKAYVSFRNIDRLSASGASDIHIQGTIAVTNLDVHLSGASDVKGDLKVNDLSIEQSGASDATITGTATNAIITASGASDVKAYDFVTENCTARASGASDIYITVNKELNVHAIGASDVGYKGTAVIRDLHTSGASSVSKKG
ncbi:MAG TPA: head GIN domain-containing protein [Puia sp.]|nr:head GIN domain-containing protein [Puia sp.]